MIPDINDTNQKETFLRDFYKGMKDMPNELVELLASPHPTKTQNVRANLDPTADSLCSFDWNPEQVPLTGIN